MKLNKVEKDIYYKAAKNAIDHNINYYMRLDAFTIGDFAREVYKIVGSEYGSIILGKLERVVETLNELQFLQKDDTQELWWRLKK